MRAFRTDLGFYDSFREARAAIRRAIARREVLRTPPPITVKWRDGSYLVVGSCIVQGLWGREVGRKGITRERLFGEPVKARRPLARAKKGKKKRRIY
jgi:hypothetical protein